MDLFLQVLCEEIQALLDSEQLDQQLLMNKDKSTFYYTHLLRQSQQQRSYSFG